MGSCASKLPIVMLRLSSIVAVLALSACATHELRPVGAELDRLSRQVASASPGDIQQAAVAQRMAQEAERLALRGQAIEVSESTIDRIVEIASDEDPRSEMTALWACSALTDLGPRSRRAIPTVERTVSRLAQDQNGRLPSLQRWEDCLLELQRIDRPSASP